MKYSKQRTRIFSALQNDLEHPTADAVYICVRRDMPNISLGTVYRNLNLLVEQGELRKISTPVSGDRFDARLAPHDHIVCNSCGKIVDFETETQSDLEQAVLEKTGFRVLDKYTVLSGICAECQKNQ